MVSKYIIMCILMVLTWYLLRTGSNILPLQCFKLKNMKKLITQLSQ